MIAHNTERKNNKEEYKLMFEKRNDVELRALYYLSD